MTLNKAPDSITENDLQTLVANEVLENKSLEYKQALAGNSDADKKEFLADVSAFANSGGGDLIFGIEENAGIPTNVCGLTGIDVDAEKLRLENIINSGVRPRIPGISITDVSLSSGATVIIIRIPRSWASPHMVTFKNHAKFYSRHSSGKYQLDVDELKAAFLLSETLSERIRNFRIDRLSRITVEESTVLLKKGPKAILHLIPFNSFSSNTRFDVISLGDKTLTLKPLGAQGWNHRYNFDGILTYARYPNENHAYSYLQVFHNGIIEAVDTDISTQLNDQKILYYGTEHVILTALPDFLSIQKNLGVTPPIFVMLSILGVRGYNMEVPAGIYRSSLDGHPIDRNDLIIPENIIEDFDCDHPAIMKPIFDAVWNAAGYPQSIYN